MERVLIVEDESLAAEKLKLLLGRIDSRFCVMDVLTSVHEAVRWFTANEADLIFLDINLSDGISFEIFQQVHVETPIIFTTAFDQYAIRAFKHNAIDYLLKPATEEDLRLSLEKYRKRQLLPAHLRVNLQKVFSEYQATQAYRNRVLISYGSKSKSITVSDIAYFIVQQKGIYLTTFTNSTHLVETTLDELDRDLDPKLFFRLNRQVVVNIHAIKEVSKYSLRKYKVDLVPKPAVEVFVPEEKVTTFKKWLNK